MIDDKRLNEIEARRASAPDDLLPLLQFRWSDATIEHAKIITTFVIQDDIEDLVREVRRLREEWHGLHETCSLRARRIQELEAALKGVLRVADRKTDEFDAARKALGEE